MSTSISRGPFRKLRVRPTRRSTSWQSRSSARALPLQEISVTRFQKSGCVVYPTGSVFQTEETRRIFARREIEDRAAERWARRLPTLLPRPR
jgi:hypothetical protein